MSLDLINDLQIVAGGSFAITADGTSNGSVIDLSNVVNAGVPVAIYYNCSTYTDGSHVPLIEDDDDSGFSSGTVVIDNLLEGQDPTSSNSPEVQATLSAVGLSKIGYKGIKRYLRPSIVSSDVTTGATINYFVVINKDVTPSGVPS